MITSTESQLQCDDSRAAFRARVEALDAKIKAMRCLPYRRVITRLPARDRVCCVEKWLSVRPTLGRHANFLRLPCNIIEELKGRIERDAN